MRIKPRCRSCNASEDLQKIKASSVFGGTKNHKFWECSSCGLVYLFPIPNQADEDRFYAQEFEKFMSIRSADDRNWSGPEMHIKTNQDQVLRRWNFLQEHVQPGNLVLEIGCSSGFMMNDLKNRGINVVGVEPSGKFSEFLKTQGHESYTTLNDLLKNKPGIKFDLIIHFFVLEHIRDTKCFLQQQLDLLKPDGKIIAEVPNANDPLTAIFKIPAFEKFYWSIAHHYYFTPNSLSFILDQLECEYIFRPEQRYDISNHLIWMQDGIPGGQGRYNNIFSVETRNRYVEDLKAKWLCDTFFVYIKKV